MMSEPTWDTLELVRATAEATRRLWAPGFKYAKAGVLLEDLVVPAQAPRSLFGGVDPRREALMAALDDVNRRYGRGTLAPAQAGIKRAWAMKADMLSPAYTTRLMETPIARA